MVCTCNNNDLTLLTVKCQIIITAKGIYEKSLLERRDVKGVNPDDFYLMKLTLFFRRQTAVKNA